MDGHREIHDANYPIAGCCESTVKATRDTKDSGPTGLELGMNSQHYH